MAEEPKTPRAQLHHKIRNEFASAVLKHYRNNPQNLDDERGRAGLKGLLKLLEDVLNCVDDFEIREKPKADS